MELIQEIGSYAGFAAVLGLAVLCALYFSQARDVKRLREWAGRAPERDAEARSRVAAANNLRQTPAAQAQAGQAQAGQAVAAQPAAAAANSGAAAAPAAAAKPKAPLVAASAAGAGAAAAASGGGARPGVPAATRAGRRVSAQTSILPAKEEPEERRRLAPRYIALIVAGVLVVGGGIAVGVIQLLGDDPKSGSSSAQSDQATSLDPGQEEQKAAESKPLRPGDISVAVFNAAGVNGLASNFGDKVQAEGFTKDNVGNYRGGQRAESVVMYAKGKEREARLVRRRFDISAIEPASPEVLADAPQADVIVVIGADKAGQ